MVNVLFTTNYILHKGSITKQYCRFCLQGAGEDKVYRMKEELAFRGIKAERREKIIRGLKNITAPDDVVASILSFLSVEKIPLDVKRIHSIFSELKKKFPEFFEEFVFSENDYYPYSGLLERVLFRLQNADLINTVNPDFKVCIISNESKDHIKKNILTLFKGEDQEKLHQMGEIFEEALSI